MGVLVKFVLLASFVVFVLWKIRGIASDNPDEDDYRKAKEARQLINEKTSAVDLVDQFYRERPYLKQYRRKESHEEPA